MICELLGSKGAATSLPSPVDDEQVPGGRVSRVHAAHQHVRLAVRKRHRHDLEIAGRLVGKAGAEDQIPWRRAAPPAIPRRLLSWARNCRPARSARPWRGCARYPSPPRSRRSRPGPSRRRSSCALSVSVSVGPPSSDTIRSFDAAHQEPELPAIGREERRARRLGPRDGRGLELVVLAEPQLGAPLRGARRRRCRFPSGEIATRLPTGSPARAPARREGRG